MQWRSYKLAVFLENKILGTLENSDFAELYKMFDEAIILITLKNTNIKINKKIILKIEICLNYHFML